MTAGRRLGLWLPGLLVAAAAAVATAHGLYEVARAAGAPTPIAALYPLICDGLALVAYGATSRLYEPSARAYAWTIVVLAAGLSGLAQAAYLAGRGVQDVPAWLRFGVGFWPAAAAAIVAHLLHLLARTAAYDGSYGRTTGPYGCTPGPYEAPYGRTTEPYGPVQPAAQAEQELDEAPAAGDRARSAARDHRDRTGSLPTVTELMALAEVARGTAGAALKQLRTEHLNGTPRRDR